MQSFSVLAAFCAVLPLVSTFPSSNYAPSASYEFGIREENGVEKSTCSAVHKVSYLDYMIEDGIRKMINKTITMPTFTCCPGYELRGGKCFPKDQDDPCRNLTCPVDGAECVVIRRRCGHKMAVFMKGEELLKACHDQGYLDLLACPERCDPHPCHTSSCPLLNSTEVVCDSNDCTCTARWFRKDDGIEMDCLTGKEKDECSNMQQ